MVQTPLPVGKALGAIARSVACTVGLLARGAVHLPRTHVGRRLTFADGTSARIYRETVVDRGPTVDPCFLVVEFRLRGVRGRGHRIFQAESLLNTPLFVGFPGFVSKWWLAHDDNGAYRGLYEWDGAERADSYVRALWCVLALVSVRGSIQWHVLPGMRRAAVADEPRVLGPGAALDTTGWWYPVAMT